tara:strand:+ start:2120 stop:2554 length:435 start_codon:yes stop_codon:yes gene_type:complete
MKITINSIEAKFGKPNAEGVCTPFWAVVFNGSEKATIWDEQIAKTVLGKIPLTCEVEIKTTSSGYKNIRSLNIATGAEVTILDSNELKPQKATPNPQRVGLFVKLAVEMLIAAPQEGKNVEECLCENIQEIKRLEEFTLNLLSQ